jgi:serralysin
MAEVTVLGAKAETITLKFTSSANAGLAQHFAGNITDGVNNGSIVPFEYTGNPFIPLAPPGKMGEFTQEGINGRAILPSDYNAVVVDTKFSTVFGGGAPNETVLSGKGNFTFHTGTGSGFIFAGGGKNLIDEPATGGGNWQIHTGNGFDTIFALSGNNTISAGTGHNEIVLGSGNNVVNSRGTDTITADGGADTIHVTGHHHVVVHGGTGILTFVGGSGPSTVFGGSGRETLFGGSGNDQFFAGSGSASLVGGSGADTLFGGKGTATMVGGTGADIFAFAKGHAGGADTIEGFNPALGQKVSLQGYGPHAVANALASQHNVGGSTIITLSDGTMVTFDGVSHLVRSDFH